MVQNNDMPLEFTMHLASYFESMFRSSERNGYSKKEKDPDLQSEREIAETIEFG